MEDEEVQSAKSIQIRRPMLRLYNVDRVDRARLTHSATPNTSPDYSPTACAFFSSKASQRAYRSATFFRSASSCC